MYSLSMTNYKSKRVKYEVYIQCTLSANFVIPTFKKFIKVSQARMENSVMCFIPTEFIYMSSMETSMY